VFRVDVGQFDGHNVLYHRVCWRQPRPEEIRDDVDDLLVQAREAEHLLLHLVAAVLKCQMVCQNIFFKQKKVIV
jgi:hypothetical protein